MRIRIVSGGQTGVDRGALDAALAFGAECGGWCPEGRRAEDGPIPETYPLKELPGGGYADRTRRNVADSDGTLVIEFNNPGPGTVLTGRIARETGKPLLVLDGETLNPEEGAGRAARFVEQYRIGVLNVAGPRAGGEPRAYAFARSIIGGLLRS